MRCTAASFWLTWAQVSPAREGTVTGGGPLEGTTVTVLPSLSERWAGGAWLAIRPAATLVEYWAVAATSAKCSRPKTLRADARVRPVTAGTGCEGVKTWAWPARSTPTTVTSTTRTPTTATQGQRRRRRRAMAGPPWSGAWAGGWAPVGSSASTSNTSCTAVAPVPEPITVVSSSRAKLGTIAVLSCSPAGGRA